MDVANVFSEKLNKDAIHIVSIDKVFPMKLLTESGVLKFKTEKLSHVKNLFVTFQGKLLMTII